MKNGHYEGGDIKVLTEEERKGIKPENLKVAAEKHQAGFGTDKEKAENGESQIR